MPTKVNELASNNTIRRLSPVTYGSLAMTFSTTPVVVSVSLRFMAVR